jgi:hypothetical protein
MLDHQDAIVDDHSGAHTIHMACHRGAMLTARRFCLVATLYERGSDGPDGYSVMPDPRVPARPAEGTPNTGGFAAFTPAVS